jgi:hypothetical protein
MLTRFFYADAYWIRTTIRGRWRTYRPTQKDWINNGRGIHKAHSEPEAEEWGMTRKWLRWLPQMRMRFFHSHAILPCSWIMTFPDAADDQGPRWLMENSIHPERRRRTELAMAAGLRNLTQNLKQKEWQLGKWLWWLCHMRMGVLRFPGDSSMLMRFSHANAILPRWWGSPMLTTFSHADAYWMKTTIHGRWRRSGTMEKNWIRDEAEE